MKHGMDVLAENLLQYSTIKLKDIAAPGSKKRELDTSGVPVEVMGKYSAEDADITLQLSAVLKRQVKESGMEKLFRTVELPLLPVLADMEFSGIRVLPESLEKASVKVGAIIDGLRERSRRPSPESEFPQAARRFPVRRTGTGEEAQEDEDGPVRDG